MSQAQRRPRSLVVVSDASVFSKLRLRSISGIDEVCVCFSAANGGFPRGSHVSRDSEGRRCSNPTPLPALQTGPLGRVLRRRHASLGVTSIHHKSPFTKANLRPLHLQLSRMSTSDWMSDLPVGSDHCPEGHSVFSAQIDRVGPHAQKLSRTPHPPETLEANAGVRLKG